MTPRCCAFCSARGDEVKRRTGSRRLRLPGSCLSWYASLLGYQTLHLAAAVASKVLARTGHPCPFKMDVRRHASGRSGLCFVQVGWMCYKRRAEKPEMTQPESVFRIIGKSRELAREIAGGGSRVSRSAGAGHELLPALLDASSGAKLQADLSGLRLLYVLLGFLLSTEHARLRRGKRFIQDTNSTLNCKLFRRRERGTANDGSGSGWSKRAGY